MQGGQASRASFARELTPQLEKPSRIKYPKPAMATTPSTSHPHWPTPERVVRARWKLFLSAAIGFIAFIFIPREWGLVVRVLIGWDIGVALYILLALWTIHYSDTTHIRLLV